MIRLITAGLLVGAGCSSAPAVPDKGASKAAPERARTAGDDLIAMAPAGADAILELDVRRLRANQTVGPLIGSLAGPAGTVGGMDLARDADAVLLCAYGVADGARQLVLVRGLPREFSADGVRRLSEAVVAVGPDRLLARAEAVIGGHEPALSSDQRLMAARTWAMPDKAKGASIRGAAVLDFDARVAVASRLDISDVPVAISLWGDVVDDLAVVTRLVADDDNGAERLAAAAAGVRERLARHASASWLRLRRILHSARIAVRDDTVEVILVIGPARLSQLVELYMKRLGAIR